LSIREEVLINVGNHDPISDRSNSQIMNSREITQTGRRNRAVANCQKFGGILKFPDIRAFAVSPIASNLGTAWSFGYCLHLVHPDC